MSVTYTAVLPVRDHTVAFLSALLHAERQWLGTRTGTRALGCYRQAILVLRWLLDATRVKQLAGDNAISVSTGYAYLHEGLTVLAACAPGLGSVLLAAKMAGYAHVNIDGTLIETDRCRTPGPTPGVDLWWSAKHANHGGNVQVITAPAPVAVDDRGDHVVDQGETHGRSRRWSGRRPRAAQRPFRSTDS